MIATENMFEQFIVYTLPKIIIGFGLIGNLLGLVTLMKRYQQLARGIGPIYIYRFLFITDSIVLLLYINGHLDRVYSMQSLFFSSITCKIFIFLSPLFYSLSSFLLIYILFERYLAINFPVDRYPLSNSFRKEKPQIIYTIIVFIISFIYFSPLISYSNIIEIHSNINNENITWLTCSIEPNVKKIVEPLFFINRILLPFILIFFFSTLLICKIVESKGRMNSLYSDQERNQLKEDIYLSYISILFNLIQYLFLLPFIMIFFIYNDEQSAIFFLGVNIFNLSFAFNFYFLLFANSLFRQQFYSIFRSRTQTNNTVVIFEMQPMCRRS